jgi:hypothetical protein
MLTRNFRRDVESTSTAVTIPLFVQNPTGGSPADLVTVSFGHSNRGGYEHDADYEDDDEYTDDTDEW